MGTFETTLTDVGGAYDNTTSTFTAPHCGVYYFSMNGDHHTSSGSATAYLYQNDELKAAGYSNDQDDMATVSAVLLLEQGDAITVANKNAGTVWTAHENTHFEGYMITR